MNQDVLEALAPAALSNPVEEEHGEGPALPKSVEEHGEGPALPKFVEDGGGEAPYAPGAPEACPPDSTDFDPIESHFAALLRQGEELRAQDPDFDLEEALRDADFLRLTAPGMGVSVRQAWLALHGEALLRRRSESREMLARAVSAGALRPREGGGSGAALLSPDPRSMDPRSRAELKRRIFDAAVRGEKIYP